jgi:hypothetical protein
VNFRITFAYFSLSAQRALPADLTQRQLFPNSCLTIAGTEHNSDVRSRLIKEYFMASKSTRLTKTGTKKADTSSDKKLRKMPLPVEEKQSNKKLKKIPLPDEEPPKTAVKKKTKKKAPSMIKKIIATIPSKVQRAKLNLPPDPITEIDEDMKKNIKKRKLQKKVNPRTTQAQQLAKGRTRSKTARNATKSKGVKK